MNEGQGQPGQLENISLRLIISKNEGNSLRNSKVIAQVSRHQAELKKTDLVGQGQDRIQLKRLEDVVTNVIMLKYEDNPLKNNKVITYRQ